MSGVCVDTEALSGLAVRMAVVDAALDGEARFRMLSEAIPQIVWTASPDGGVDYCNRRWFELTGRRLAQEALAFGPIRGDEGIGEVGHGGELYPG